MNVFLEVTLEGVPKNDAFDALNSIPSGNSDLIEIKHESQEMSDGTIEKDWLIVRAFNDAEYVIGAVTFARIRWNVELDEVLYQTSRLKIPTSFGIPNQELLFETPRNW